MLKPLLKILAVVVGLTLANPASAVVYRYRMTNGDLLTIDTIKQMATFSGQTIKATLHSPDFANFQGGKNPHFTAILTGLGGKQFINGKWVTDNPKNATTTHPQKIIFDGSTVNLWAWWGNPIVGGDYITTIKSYRAVPEPGVALLLLGGLGGLALARRRRGQAQPNMALVYART